MNDNILNVIMKNSDAVFTSDASGTEERTPASKQEFNQLSTPSMFWRPNYLASSAWIEHVPFAFWLVENLRPKTIIELGSHYGVSYFSFCQAVQRLGLDAQCFAIDTWKGDDHAGTYGEDVYQQVRQYNDQQYSDFSRLVRSTFDEALRHFENGSIDLLHIDGLHTLESVSHDFESWLPKLSDDAVVIMHDTNVRERGFGVYKLFSTLKENYPHFEFSHGHGLGVLGVGINQKPALISLYETKETQHKSVCEIFGRLGRACADARNLIQAEEKLKNLKSDIENKKNKIEELVKQHEKVSCELSDKNSLLIELKQKEAIFQERNSLERGQLVEKIITIKEEKNELANKVNEAQKLIQLKEDILRDLDKSISILHTEKNILLEKQNDLKIENEILKEKLDSVYEQLAEEKKRSAQHQKSSELYFEEKNKVEKALNAALEKSTIEIQKKDESANKIIDEKITVIRNLEKTINEKNETIEKLKKQNEENNSNQQKIIADKSITIKELQQINDIQSKTINDKEDAIDKAKKNIEEQSLAIKELQETVRLQIETIKNQKLVIDEKVQIIEQQKKVNATLNEESEAEQLRLRATIEELYDQVDFLKKEYQTQTLETTQKFLIKTQEKQDVEHKLNMLAAENKSLLNRIQQQEENLKERFVEIATLTNMIKANKDDYLKNLELAQNKVAAQEVMINEVKLAHAEINKKHQENEAITVQLKATISELEDKVRILNDEVNRKIKLTEEIQIDRDEKDLLIQNLNKKLEEKEEVINQLNRNIEDILQSRSWKITTPLRKAKNLIR